MNSSFASAASAAAVAAMAAVAGGSSHLPLSAAAALALASQQLEGEWKMARR